MIDNEIKTLQTIFYALFSGVLTFFAIVEFVIGDMFSSSITVDAPTLDFAFESGLVIITLGAIYLSLRLPKIKMIEEKLIADPIAKFREYSIVRFAMLEGVAILNIVSYMCFGNSSYAWLATIALLASPFIYPTKERFCNETHFEEQR